LLIFFVNTSAENYKNPFMYVKVISSQRCNTFETQCTPFSTRIYICRIYIILISPEFVLQLPDKLKAP